MTLRTRLVLALCGSGLAILLGAFVAREVAIRYASEASLRSSIEARLGALDREACEGVLDMERREFRPRSGGPRFPPRPDRPEDPAFRGEPRPGGGVRFDGPPPDRAREREPGLGPGRFDGGGGGRGRGREMMGAPRVTRVFFYDPDFKPRPPNGPPFPEAAKTLLRNGETFVTIREHGGFFGAVATAWPGGACTYGLAVMPTPPPLAAFSSLIIGALLLIVVPALALWFALAKPVARIRALAEGVRAAAARHYETSAPVTGHDEIAELGHAFNDASALVRAHVADVERREKALRDFVATLRENAPTDAMVTVAAIAQETQYIASLLANLEAVARLESDVALHERHPVDLTALVERVAVRHHGVAQTGGIDFNHSVPASPVWVTGDVTLIEQAVNNLAHNAIQYNRPGGHVALVLETLRERFAVRVSDDGPGVSGADLARLGESRFRSDEARSRRPSGTGLGLSITRDVARRHDFTLSLGNRAEGGFEAVLQGVARTTEQSPSA